MSTENAYKTIVLSGGAVVGANFQQVNFKVARHSCHRCGATFPMFDQLQEHRANEHGEEEAA